MTARIDALTPPPPPPSFGAHLVDYFRSAQGASDLLKTVQLTAQYAQLFSRTHEERLFAGGVRESASDAWSLLLWPRVIVKGGELCQKVHRLFFQNVGPSADLEQLKYDVATHALDFVSPLAEGTFFLHAKKWINLGRLAPCLCVLFEGTSIISDVLDIRKQWGKLKELRDEIAVHRPSFVDADEGLVDGDVTQLTQLTQSRHLALLALVKDVTSIVLSTAGIATLIAGIAVESSLVLTTLLLLLATLFLVTKIFAHFYEKMVVLPQPV